MLIEVQDDKVSFFKDVLHNYSFIKKSEQISDKFGTFFYDLYDSVNYVNQSKKGLVITRDAKDFLNEL
jgi:hypothetical protein